MYGMAHAQRITERHLHKSGLIYVEETPPGIRRRRCGRGYSFIDEHGECIKAGDERDRLLKIAVPPSYEDVWYCPKPNGHLQATGFDSKMKKQYFYHPKWEDLRDAVKFNMMYEFGQKLPLFRSRIYRTLKDPKSDHDYVLAGMARILDRTGMRAGNDQASESNKTYGLTTLKKSHVIQNDDRIEFEYKGKGLVDIHTEFSDKKIKDIIDYCTELSGQKLFKYKKDDDTVCAVDSGEFNSFLKDMIGPDFSAKDFRTWRFSVFFLDEVLKSLRSEDKFVLKNLLQNVSEKSGNTPAILQQSYIHPVLISNVKDENRKVFEQDAPSENGLLKTESLFLKILKSA